MFSKYWRTYPWWLQLILFVLMIFTLASFFVLVTGVIVPRIAGVDATQLANISEKSPRTYIDGALIAQALVSTGVFLLPALLFAYLDTPRPMAFLGLRKPRKNIHLLLVVLLMLGAMPIFLGIETLVKHIDLGPAAKAAEEQNNKLTNAFLNMGSPWDFVKTFTILAILPALGEEMTFRGVLMRFAAKRTKSIAFPVIITSLMFAAMHGNISGLPSIFLAGVLLAVIYYLTGSLWCSILGHMLNNGLQIIVIYVWKDSAAMKTAMDSNSLPLWVTVSGVLLFAISLWLLIKNKTPLRANWTDDYTPEELTEENTA